MRDSYYTRPLRDFIDTLLDIEQYQPTGNHQIHELTWSLELLLLDNHSQERQWRQAAAEPLARLLSVLEAEHGEQRHRKPSSRTNTQSTPESWLDWDQVRSLINELAY